VTPFEKWTADYKSLIQTQRTLAEFIKDGYEHYLGTIAHEYFDVQFKVDPADRHEPCHDCKVNVSTLIEPERGWYFEWLCVGGYTGFGCSASGEGWYVPMYVIEDYLARHEIT
jgi:hypothetical protein